MGIMLYLYVGIVSLCEELYCESEGEQKKEKGGRHRCPVRLSNVCAMSQLRV